MKTSLTSSVQRKLIVELEDVRKRHRILKLTCYLIKTIFDDDKFKQHTSSLQSWCLQTPQFLIVRDVCHSCRSVLFELLTSIWACFKVNCFKLRLKPAAYSKHGDGAHLLEQNLLIV